MQSTIIQQNVEKDEMSGFEKGRAFEDFIVTLFNKRKFRLLEWRSDKQASNGVLPLSCTYPDLEFECSKGRFRYRFAVECKWRKEFLDDKVTWAKTHQIDAYDAYQFERRISVYVAIGIGGSPDKPEHLFITPLDNIKMYPDVFKSRLIPYSIDREIQFETSEQLPLF